MGILVFAGAFGPSPESRAGWDPTLKFQVIHPNGGEEWLSGSTQTINWYLADSSYTSVSIALYAAGEHLRNIAEAAPNDGSHTWDIPSDLPEGTSYTIQIVWFDDRFLDLDRPEIADSSDAPFSIFIPPGLETAETLDGTGIHLEWSNRGETPIRFLGLVYDLYTEDWVENPSMGDIWYRFSPEATSGTINPGRTGGYFVWISNHRQDGRWHPCQNPLPVLLTYGPLHTPLEARATALNTDEDKTVRLDWKPERYGTWLYWIIAYDPDARIPHDLKPRNWIPTKRSGLESLWHYIPYGSDAFINGSIQLEVPGHGPYLFFLGAMGWDAETWSEFAVAYTATAPTETVLLPGDVPLELVRIPAGSFLMGSSPDERSRFAEEGPLHRVDIGYDFHMGKYEVSEKQWFALMGSAPGNFTWDEAQAFLAALNQYIKESDQGPALFRLPSEAEWEYACRAGTQTRYFFGNSLSVGDGDIDGPAGTLPGNRSDYMVFGLGRGVTPALSRLPNPFGLHNMHGFAWEWCQDWYHPDYSGAPTDGTAWESPAGLSRVQRGGDAFGMAVYCRSATRMDHYLLADRGKNSGFRVVRSPASGTGSITIDVTPNWGGWILSGPEAFTPLQGTGDRLGETAIAESPPGAYTLTCTDSLPFLDPPTSKIIFLHPHGKIFFEPLYKEDSDTTRTKITVDVTPSTAEWALTGPMGFTSISGKGDRLGVSAIYGVPPGDYVLTCRDSVAVYKPPDPTTNTLISGATLSFTPLYELPGVEEVNVFLPGDVPLTLVRILAGSFQMGSPEDELGHSADEGPVHTVNIDYDFHMGKYEVTVRQWDALLNGWPDFPTRDPDPKSNRYPINRISWEDYQHFVAKLNEHVAATGQGPATFRMPTEAEWEYACRAGSETRFFFGDSLSVSDHAADGPAGDLPGNRSDYMWFASHTEGPREVGRRLPNQFGLHDILGNVREACLDTYRSDYLGAPSDGSAWEGVEVVAYRVNRGGCYYDDTGECRSANRFRYMIRSERSSLGLRLIWIRE